MFCVYMQEVNSKRCIIFNLFYLRFCYGHDVCTENFSFKICGVVPWRGIAKTITLKPTRTLYFHKTSLTNFYFSPLAVHTRYFSCVAVTNRDWPALLSTVPVYLRHQFRISFHDEESRFCTCYFLSPSRKEWLKQRYFSSSVNPLEH